MTIRSPTATRGIFQAGVIHDVALCREHYRLTLSSPEFPHAEPGQFIQIDCQPRRIARGRPHVQDWSPGMRLGQSGDDFRERKAVLRRPFSIAGMRRHGSHCEIEIIGRTIGPGTRMLCGMRSGDETKIIGPLGRPFAINQNAAISILVAGGVGLPPLLWLAEALYHRGLQVIAICGARTAELLPLTLSSPPLDDGTESLCSDEFDRVRTAVIVTSDDGTVGFKGTTADALTTLLLRHGDAAPRSVVYTCGPEAMMRRIAVICARRGIECQAALERLMGCGMGTCQSCVVRLRDQSERGWHYELCCTHGPAFDATTVDWDTPP